MTLTMTMPSEKLKSYTANADVGLSLDKPTNLNYKYSLPNKVFDYIHAGVPVLVSDLPEVRSIIEQYQVGTVIRSHDPVDIAKCIREVIQNKTQLDVWRKNCEIAARELNWQKESEKLNELFQDLI